jgi:tetratricopeptide (TPR) repeat protein
VLGDYIEAGAFDEVSSRASSVEGWRQGIVFADLGRALAEVGRLDDARAAIGQAQQIRRQITDFHGPRIEHHIAQAMAALGDDEFSNEISEAVATADRVQYLGRSIAMRAVNFARDGRLDAAMDYLGTVEIEDKEVDDLAWWRTQGYLEIAAMPELTHEQRLRAASGARASLAAVSSARYAQGLLAVGAVYRELGDPEGAGDALDAAEALVERIPDNHPNKPIELTSLARVWAEIGESERARKLLKEAEAIIPISQPIEQPAAFAWTACSYLVLGDSEESLRVYDRALSVAESLVNPRPRALAFVAIGRSMGGEGMEVPEAIRKRLDAALAGLTPPSAKRSS